MTEEHQVSKKAIKDAIPETHGVAVTVPSQIISLGISVAEFKTLADDQRHAHLLQALSQDFCFEFVAFEPVDEPEEF